MDSGITIKNLGEFRKTLGEYRKHSKRDRRVILDTKAFYIARGAVRETASPTKERIKNELVNLRTSKIAPDAPLAAIIINSRRGKQGLPGLYGKAMKDAVMRMLSARIRARKFIASGWLAAIKALEPFAENKSRAPKMDRTVKQFGRPKGSAAPAGRRSESEVARCVITNSVSPKKDPHNALETYGLPAFVRAWEAEIASMKQYIADKMQKRANEYSTRKH